MSRNLVPNQFDYSGIYVEGQRSQFRFNKPYQGSFMAGMLTPMGDPIRVFPGKKFALKINANIISNTMVAVPLNGIYIDIFTVWVPDRIVWTHQPQFLGENDTTAWTQSASYAYPTVTFNDLTSITTGMINRSSIVGDVVAANNMLAVHYGLATKDVLTATQPAYSQTINVLPFRGYYAAWNYLFRDENYQRPVLFSKGDTGTSGEFGYLIRDYQIGISNNTPVMLSSTSGINNAVGLGCDYRKAVLMPVCKFHDAYTSLLPQPQYGNAVGLGVGGLAPIVIGDATGVTAGTAYSLGFDGSSYVNGAVATKIIDTASGSVMTNAKINADLTNALGSINNFRANVMTQRFLEALARGGRRVPELYESIYGVKNTAASKDYPELLSHERYVLGVQQVVATADGSGTGWTSHLGDRGAYSLTVLRDVPCCEKDFTEFGYLHVLYCVRSTNQYSQIIPQHFTRKLLLDEYNPYFDHIGDVDVPNHLINSSASTAGNFGYQEAWWFERTQQGIMAGALNKAYGSLSYHIIGEVFDSSLVTCTPGYLAFDPAVFNDVFVSDYWAYPQFLIDATISGRTVARMSQHSIPGIEGRI